MQGSDEKDFLAEVLGGLEDLPPGFAARFEELLRSKPEDRAEAIRKLFEEHARD